MLVLQGDLEEHLIVDVHHVGFLGAALGCATGGQLRGQQFIDCLGVRPRALLHDLFGAGERLREMLLTGLREGRTPTHGDGPQVAERRENLRGQRHDGQILTHRVFLEAGEGGNFTLRLAHARLQPIGEHGARFVGR